MKNFFVRKQFLENLKEINSVHEGIIPARFLLVAYYPKLIDLKVHFSGRREERGNNREWGVGG